MKIFQGLQYLRLEDNVLNSRIQFLKNKILV